MNGGLRYLLWCSFVGSLRAKLLKLKEIKYWFGMIGLLLYFGLLIVPGIMQQKQQPIDLDFGFIMVGSMVLFSMGLSWVFQGKRSGVGFTESEIEILFAAPLSRRELLHYRLAKVQFGLFFSTILITLFTSMSWAFSSTLWVWFSFYLLFNLIHIQGLVAILVCQRIAGRWFAWPLRLGIAAFVLLPFVWLWPAFSAAVQNGEKSLSLGQELSKSPLGHAVIKAWMFIGNLPFSASFIDALLPLLVVFGLWLVFYLLVLKFGVGFEENELAGAKVRAETIKAVRSGRLSPIKDKPVGRAWFKLAPTGALWRALAWKNFTSSMRHIPLSLFLILGIFSIQFVILFIVVGDGKQIGLKFGSLCLVFSVFLAVMGSQFVKEDLRTSLLDLELIKMLPISSLEVIRGEIYGAAGVVMTGCYALIGLFLLFVGGSAEFPIMPAFGVASVAFFLIPALVLTTFFFDNMIALLFPSWVVSKENMQLQNVGIEQIGRGVINMIIKMIGLLVFSILPGIFAGMTWFLFSIYPIKWLFPVGAMLFLLITWIEVEMGMLWMAEQFEMIDLSRENL